jgi:hypothetical protein
VSNNSKNRETMKATKTILTSSCLLVALTPMTHAAVTMNLVVNGDTETGDLTGWTTTNGMEVIDDPGATSRGTGGLAPGGDVGRYSFHGGSGPSVSTATQTIDLSTFAGEQPLG